MGTLAVALRIISRTHPRNCKSCCSKRSLRRPAAGRCAASGIMWGSSMFDSSTFSSLSDVAKTAVASASAAAGQAAAAAQQVADTSRAAFEGAVRECQNGVNLRREAAAGGGAGHTPAA